MTDTAATLYILIVSCEAAFWLVLAAALATRYLLRRERLSRLMLIALPLVDVLLLIFTSLDLKSGTPATFAHGLATAYIGFTIAFGGILVTWADQHFAHRFVGGPLPVAAPKRGWPVVRYDLMLWLRCILAWVITLALLTSLIAYLDNAQVTEELSSWFRIAFGSVVLWFVFGPLWALLFLSWRRESTP
jgi:hypothetical protein